VFGILEIREIFWRPNHLRDVLRILDIGGQCNATDSRDRVYGIAGLCGDLLDLMEKPDYADDSRTYADLRFEAETELAELYTELARDCKVEDLAIGNAHLMFPGSKVGDKLTISAAEVCFSL
jgi:hypothetical protein